ncbi:MAG TPA: branched-chain amino acid ABC transporter permease [Actinomycetota bacterium]|nr:branched-chain amino acid ABC transporter permease [Actinomycetota bacterium]
MVFFLQYVVNGLAAGFVIGLLALSLVMIYRSTRVLSFAQGVIASLGTYVYYQMQTVWEWHVLIAVPAALVVAAIVGALADLLAMRPLRKADALTRTVATLGIVLVLQVVMRAGWGGQESFVRPIVSGGISAGQFSVGAQELLTAFLAIAAAGLFGLWARTSYRGLGLQAIAEDASAARLLGVDPTRASMLAWSIGAVLAALAGILVTPTLVLNPLQMTLIMVTAFGAALLGGFTSLPMALGGGVLIGVVQSVATGYINVSGVSEAFGFIAVFAVLVLARGKRGAVALPGRSVA